MNRRRLYHFRSLAKCCKAQRWISPPAVCGGSTKVIACIEDPALIKKILTQLRSKGLTLEAIGVSQSGAPPRGDLFFLAPLAPWRELILFGRISLLSTDADKGVKNKTSAVIARSDSDVAISNGVARVLEDCVAFARKDVKRERLHITALAANNASLMLTYGMIVMPALGHRSGR